jgi:predicted glycosyltransferase
VVDKTVLLFSRDPGGANTVIPLVSRLTEKGYCVKLFGKDIALTKYAKSGLPAQDIMKDVEEISLDSIAGFIKSQMPDFIITGTSADDMTEKYIWKAAEQYGIPCFAILDQWVNYGVRFSQYSVSELKKYYHDKKHVYLPTKILVMDDLAKQKAVEEGLDESRIIVTGQPYFETIKNAANRISKKDIDELHKKLKIQNGDHIIVFASEPISKTYHETDDSEHFWGYTERTILRNLLDALAELMAKKNKEVKIIIRPHPKEDKDNFNDIMAVYEGKEISLTVDDSTDSLQLIAASDLICGMSSMFLIESAIVGKPVLSIQIGLCRENPFILDQIGILKSVLSRDDLETRLSKILENDYGSAVQFKTETEPVQRVIDAMELTLCQN